MTKKEMKKGSKGDNEMNYMVRLENNTTGIVENYEKNIDEIIGEIVIVKLHDENSNEIEVEGEVVEVLEELF